MYIVQFNAEDHLPSILNAIVTQNGDTKLTLEVAVRTPSTQQHEPDN